MRIWRSLELESQTGAVGCLVRRSHRRCIGAPTCRLRPGVDQKGRSAAAGSERTGVQDSMCTVAAFGGDPDKVALWEERAGGSCRDGWAVQGQLQGRLGSAP